MGNERSVLQSESELKRLFELSQDLFVAAGFDGYIRWVNPAYERTSGYSTEELMSRPFLEFLHPDDLQPTRDLLAGLLAPSAKSRAGRNLVVRGRQLDGSATFRQQPFSIIGYPGQRGEPSYASIINIPHTGCWRLDLKSRGLTGHIQFRTVPGRG